MLSTYSLFTVQLTDSKEKRWKW